jgi:hypothetical protein
MTIQVDGFTKRQAVLADIIWACETQDQVLTFINSLPKKDRAEAYVVMQMIVHATFDQFMETDLAEQALARYRL